MHIIIRPRVEQVSADSFTSISTTTEEQMAKKKKDNTSIDKL